MSNIPVFKDINNNWYTEADIIEGLKSIEADKCDILFVHTEVAFGMPNVDLKRKQYFKCHYTKN